MRYKDVEVQTEIKDGEEVTQTFTLRSRNLLNPTSVRSQKRKRIVFDRLKTEPNYD